MHCLQCLTTEPVFNKHKENCLIINDPQAVRVPSKGEQIMFQNRSRQLQGYPKSGSLARDNLSITSDSPELRIMCQAYSRIQQRVTMTPNEFLKGARRS